MSEFILLCLIVAVLPRKTKRQKLMYCIIVCVCMCCLVGLRNINIGQRDTLTGYVPEFQKVKEMNYAEILQSFKDPVYYCTTKLFQCFSDNVYVYLFVYGIPYNVAIAYFIYKYSKSYALSFLGVMGLSIWKISFTGMRHVIAASFLLLALDALIENKIKKHWLFIGIAACFHSSALIFLIVYPLSKIKKAERLVPVTVIVAGIAAFGRKYILLAIGFAADLFHLSRYAKYSQWSATGNGQGYLLNLLIMFSMLLLYGKSANRKEKELSCKDTPLKLATGEISFGFLKVMQLLTLLFNACAIAINEFARVGMFFSIVTIIFIPAYLQFEKRPKLRLIIKFAVGLALAILFLFIVAPRSNIIPYYFNWENYQ